MTGLEMQPKLPGALMHVCIARDEAKPYTSFKKLAPYFADDAKSLNPSTWTG
jgi:hypothetical protein